MSSHHDHERPTYTPVVQLGSVNPIKAAQRRRASMAHYVGAGSAALLLVLVTAAGASVIPCLIVAAAGGLASGVLFIRLPRILDRVFDYLHSR